MIVDMSDLSIPCPVCNHKSGSHSGGINRYPMPNAKCCQAGCTCPYSYYDIIEGNTGPPKPPEPTQLDRVEEKLDAILSWITKQQLEEMVKDLE